MSSTTTVQCKSWDEFIWQITELRRATGTRLSHLFRGHADSSWMLRSSLGRIAQAANFDDSKAVSVEKKLLDDFIRHTHLLLPPSMLGEESDLVHWWTVMQHYRAPTR